MSVLDDLQAVLDAMPVLYYGTDDQLPRGRVVMMKETDYTHKAIICHPDDFPGIQHMGIGYRFVHLRDAPLKMPPIPTEVPYFRMR